MASRPTPEQLREALRARYGGIAAAIAAGQARTSADELPLVQTASCCATDGSPEAVCSPGKNPISSDLYPTGEVAELPEAALLASLGCGNPTALAELHSGEVVLDLGSGGGIDVLLSARRVGPNGHAYGLDMSDEMLALAEQNRRQAHVDNVTFLKGEIERVPLPDQSVNVVISNCVINLSADKDRVLREAFRVLKPGGRFAVSDVVVLGRLPDAVRESMEAWAGCMAGALEEEAYRAKLAAAGFADVEVEVTRHYQTEELAGNAGCSLDPSAAAGLQAGEGSLVSAFVRARKP